MANGYGILADLVLLLHLAFVVFVVVGGAWLARRPQLLFWHLPAFLWGALVELSGWNCPLTPLEQWLRMRAGESGYAGDFLGHYLLAIIYPEGLTRPAQLVLGIAVLVVNAFWYLRLWRRARPR